MRCTMFFYTLAAQTDPFSQGTNELLQVGHTMVFMAILIAIAGIGFRIYLANKRKAGRIQGHAHMPWTAPPYVSSQPAPPGVHFEHGVFCPRCGLRNGGNFCVTCGYDLQPVIRQVREQFSQNR